MNLYHYTTMDNASSIMAAFREANPGISWTQASSMAGSAYHGAMRPSLLTGRDAHHGPGYYFTEIMPGSLPRTVIAQRLWRDTRKVPFTEAYIEFRIDGRCLRPAGAQCWVHPYDENATHPRITAVTYGYNEDP